MDAAEEWRPVPGFPGYRVSDAGHVRSERRELSGTNIGGYRIVGLRRGGQTCRFGIHRLVMLAFTGEPPRRHVVNHRDMDPANNNLANLEYCTVGQNVNHAAAILSGRLEPGASALPLGEPEPCRRCGELMYDSKCPRIFQGRWQWLCEECGDLIPHTPSIDAPSDLS